ncbi:MAG: hypothetical protein LAT64_11100 [Phycisphaerales bacterium]|nr:hypothetical protein [Planctomycetota bacterium]MCH8509297.1 hypothetical protein [Phycisphaerales bacterium]
MTPSPARPLMLLLLAMLAALPACRTTWQDHYRGAPAGSYTPTDAVVIREVPWSRLDETLHAIEERRADSDIHWEEWTREQHLEEQAELLRGLQISEHPDDIIVIGRSVFRSTSHLSPEDGSLERFARSIGADYAVWSAHYVGTRRVARDRPVQQHGVGFGYGSRRGRHTGVWTRTVYVPVSVDADEYAWVVYYLRRR